MAVDTGQALSVRSGGHSAMGHSTHDHGIVLDLAHLDAVELLDPASGLVRVGGGATWGRVATALSAHGLGITSGDTSSVGVGGLTLGGGIGWRVRRHGLAIDSLVAAEVVTAEGELLRVEADHHADLFWALRGGGGNFGVVLAFEFLAQPVRTVRYGTVAYALDDVPGLVTRWRDAMRVASEDLTSTLVLMPGLMRNPLAGLVLVCQSGDDPDTAENDLALMHELGDVQSQSGRGTAVRRCARGRPAPCRRTRGRAQHARRHDRRATWSCGSRRASTGHRSRRSSACGAWAGRWPASPTTRRLSRIAGPRRWW